MQTQLVPIPLDDFTALNDLLTHDDDDALLLHLADLAHLARWARFNVRALMVEAVNEGITYQDIADAVGVSRQSAWEAINPRGGMPLSVDLDQLKLF